MKLSILNFERVNNIFESIPAKELNGDLIQLLTDLRFAIANRLTVGVNYREKYLEGIIEDVMLEYFESNIHCVALYFKFEDNDYFFNIATSGLNIKLQSSIPIKYYLRKLENIKYDITIF